jgi:hypothetical protein
LQIMAKLGRFSTIHQPAGKILQRRRRATTTAAVGTPYGSVNFNGSTQYLNIASTSAFGFGTADFTIECWWRPTANQRSDVLDFWSTPGTNPTTRFDIGRITSTTLDLYTDSSPGGSGAKITGPTIASLLNAWHHIAVTRQSGSIKMWVDGIQAGSTYSANVLDMGTGGMELRIMGDHGASANGSGNLTNIRVVTGTALYTATFIPPTGPLQVVSGTQLLLSTTNDANFLKDSSSNNLTVTNTGSVVTASLNPFYTITTTATVNGNVSVGTANGSPFGSSVNSYTMASQPVNPPYNYISVPGGSGFAFGTGDYTVEWFQYVITSTTNQRAFWYGTSPSVGVSIEGASTSKTFYTWPGASAQGSTFNMAVGSWQHFALVRISGRTYFYKDGICNNPGGTVNSTNITDTTSTLYFGYRAGSNIQSEQFVGSMTNIRIVKGLGVYTGNFTVPTSPLTQTAGANPYGGSNTAAITSGLTSLLLNP